MSVVQFHVWAPFFRVHVLLSCPEVAFHFQKVSEYAYLDFNSQLPVTLKFNLLKSLQDIKEDNEINKNILIKEINNEISEAEGEIKEKKETALDEISSISESLAIEILENLSVGKIDKGKIAALSKIDK